ncbi:polysaccharide biosynthesis C-terminal domain-containing protein [Candidatus Absconditicoccus praedator]|uniref:oligosaccharide flippase family protein n=1 Tax=Candidatus Absconditicoccus praedator TaxID=2735562 RepID=UPI001E2F8DE3|nr:polysaccharide biosynthesis C-terminal domain-containing protein [Candidatus Absconditicoccus praedator]UFX82745.1 polysaccharide biosynthesis C-terminal domain-containing protein [Candidatus Absconditicoccus praedator]
MSEKTKNLLPDQTLASKLISKGFWLYLFAILGLPLGYFVRVILSNDLTVSEVGIIYSLIGLMGILSTLSTLGISSGAMVYFLPKYIVDSNSDYVTTIYKIVRYINIGMTAIIGLAFYFFIQYFGTTYIEHPEATAILYIFLGVFLFLNLRKPIEGIYKTVQNVFVPKFTEFLKQVLISILVISFFLLGIGDLINYGYAFLVGGIVSYLIYYLVFRYKYSSQILAGKFIKDQELFKKIIFFGMSALIASNAMLIIKNIDLQMLLVIGGAESAGYYTNYMSLMAIVMFFLSPILGILFPIISELKSKGQMDKLELLQDFLYKYFIVFAFSIIFLLGVFGEEISVILFGEEFLYSGTLLTYLVIFAVFKLIFTINLAILMGIGEAKKRTNILVAVMILNIILNILLIPTLGALGAGIATGVSWAVIAITSFYFVYQHQKINFDWFFYGKNLLFLLVVSTIYYLFTKDIFVLENAYRWENLLYIVLIGVFTYLLMLGLNFKEAKIFVKELKRFRKSK